VPTTQRVDSGFATLRRDADGVDAWTLDVGGSLQSHVDLADPTRLSFDYTRRIGHVIDLVAGAGAAVDAVHLGGGGLTLPRYLAATRPGSRQRVFETDAALTELVRRELPLVGSWRIRVGGVDARKGLASLRPGSADLVVADVFAAARTPAHLASVELVRDVARVLRPGGTYVTNLVDRPPLGFARGQVATVGAVFRRVAVLIDPGILRGRRHGNVVVVASDAPLPTGELGHRCAADPVPSRVVAGDALTRFTRSAPVVTDRTAASSPALVAIPSPDG
jgi:SAM-dependent methyltransferase